MTGDMTLTGKALIGATALAAGETLIGTTTGDRLAGDVALAREALIGTTARYSALMFGRAVMTGKALVSMTGAGEALVGILWIRDRCDPREV